MILIIIFGLILPLLFKLLKTKYVRNKIIISILIATSIYALDSYAAKAKISLDKNIELNQIVLTKYNSECSLSPNGLTGNSCYAITSNNNSTGTITLTGDLNSDVTITSYPYYGNGYTATLTFFDFTTKNPHPKTFTLNTAVKNKGTQVLSVGIIIEITDYNQIRDISNIPIDVTIDYL